MVNRGLHALGRISLAVSPVALIFFTEALPNEIDKIIRSEIKLDYDLVFCVVMIILLLFIYIDYSINKGYYRRMEVR